MTINLSKLERVSLTDVWNSEPRDFTPWLSQPENIEILGATLGLTIKTESIERRVGRYSADIVCKDTQSEKYVLIENQLYQSDHSHLGQIVTYASGLKATTIIWIAASFTDEHKAAIDWLNEITSDEYSFFGLEIELWRIDDSPAAPRFNIISKPNYWSKSFEKSNCPSDEELSIRKQQQIEYWNSFKEFILRKNKSIDPTRPARPRHWMDFPLGKSGFHYSVTVDVDKDRCGTELYINNEQPKECLRRLLSDKDAIEAEIGEHLEWQELPSRHASRIVLYKNGCTLDPSDKEIEEQMEWMADLLERFQKAFTSRVKMLNPNQSS